MKRLLIVFLSYVISGLMGGCKSQQTLVGQCFDKKYEDSIVHKYLETLAWEKGYNHADWGLYCDTVIALCPNIAEAYREKAIPHIKYGNYAVAMPLEDKAVALNQGQWLDYRGFLKVIFTKDYAGAIIDFENSEKNKPFGGLMDHTYSFYLALSYTGLKDFNQAIVHLKKDSSTQKMQNKKNDIHFNTLLYFGIAYYQLNNYTTANYYLAACLQQYNNHPDALYYIGSSNYKLNKKKEATTHLKASLAAIKAGYSMNEDNEAYCNYPYQIAQYEIENAIENINISK